MNTNQPLLDALDFALRILWWPAAIVVLLGLLYLAGGLVRASLGERAGNRRRPRPHVQPILRRQ